MGVRVEQSSITGGGSCGEMTSSRRGTSRFLTSSLFRRGRVNQTRPPRPNRAENCVLGGALLSEGGIEVVFGSKKCEGTFGSLSNSGRRRNANSGARQSRARCTSSESVGGRGGGPLGTGVCGL